MLLCTALLLAGSMYACESAPVEKQDLTRLTIEQLMDVEVEVTSASRKEQKLSETAAAVYVIARDDIRRAGSATVAEALRLAPGMNVARIDANKWAVSCRGFNDLFANKMLVLVDGRSVYTPTFSGVWWDALGVEIEDVDRIEVIRGPGAAVWGANAVNAVINIITIPAASTAAATALLQGGGADIQSSGSLRLSGYLGDSGGYRFYASRKLYNNLNGVSGGESNDAWDRSSAGLRMDWKTNNNDAISCQLNTYRGSANQVFRTNLDYPMFAEELTDTVSTSGTNILARWSHRQSDTSDTAVQVYFDHTERLDKLLFNEVLDTYDLDFQHRSLLGKRHDVVWGLGYRLTKDATQGGHLVSFSPTSRAQSLLSAFVNDEIALAGQRVRLTLGTKLEHNEFTGFEIQPNIRLLCSLAKGRSVWGAVSRAVRVPARIERDIRFTLLSVPDGYGGQVKTVVTGNPAFVSEELIAYEIGYRDQSVKNLSWDVTGFMNDYSKLRTLAFAAPYMEGADTIMPAYMVNDISGKAYGIELAANWRVTSNWRLAGTFSVLRTDFHASPFSTDPKSVGMYEGSEPRTHYNLRSSIDLPGNQEFDLTFYSYSRLAGRGVSAFNRLDGRFSWHAKDATDISIQMTNALNSRHVEFGSYYGETVSLLGRGVSASIARQF